ncbi:rRNA N6-adenosine-methyltransferase ZCCHC4-like isoform X2 [Wyeomyia smithii]|uniref:rRNA N6-adenosine-methyltransferase ZCCHC4-like isoform X2 n=1 Tax=Wyeomyia smithii TaxID=174621 RepID=UPI0024680B14|nr:rRNA N6-adenosine-methyltransferase ZCCHC4-like isoform X2 [Wyeomyia smithii]
MASHTLILDEINSNPSCKHGPTVLFQRNHPNGSIVCKYYGCSASRDGKCSFYTSSDQIDSSEIVYNNTCNITQVRNTEASQKFFCVKCQRLVLKLNIESHNNHKIILNLREDVLRQPARFLLTPLTDDGIEAQYFFSDDTLICIEGIIEQLKITKIISLGAPRLHEYLLTSTATKSLLLDIDKRFECFYDATSFLQYNMFNHHFFGGSAAQDVFISFLQTNEQKDRLCIFTDPPFGCRTELLANTIVKINQLYNTTNSLVQHVLPVFWVFPYFMEAYIKNELPSMEISDYHVSYTNHRRYHNGKKGLKNGSPVRFFTNVPLESFELPSNQGYKFCYECNKSVHKTNIHCSICSMCASKNGATYKHCVKCNWCVKPNYKHCNKCGRCAQKHDCHFYQTQITCRICMNKGHVELTCSFWKHFKEIKRHYSGCMVCGKKTHIIKKCPERKIALKEKYFLGKYNNVLNT